MKNRAIRTIEALYNAPNRTLTASELEKIVKTNWAPRGVSEARALGAVIDGDNPYTLVSWTEKHIPKKPIRWEFDNNTNTARPIYA